MDSPNDGSSPPEEGTAEASGADTRTRLEVRFERALSLSRVVVIVPVIVLLLSAMSSFAYGTDVFVRSVGGLVEDPHLTSHNLGILLVLTDLFLVGATRTNGFSPGVTQAERALQGQATGEPQPLSVKV